MKRIFCLNENNVFDNVYWGEINGPTYVYLEVTRKCNCRCKFCQVNEITERDIDEKLANLIMR